MKTYTKHEILKAAEIGMVSKAAAERIISLLDEARQQMNGTMVSFSSDTNPATFIPDSF